MSIESNVTRVRALLDKMSQYERLVISESFEPDTIADMKSKAKVICDEAKSEIDAIKSEVDNWS